MTMNYFSILRTTLMKLYLKIFFYLKNAKMLVNIEILLVFYSYSSYNFFKHGKQKDSKIFK